MHKDLWKELTPVGRVMIYTGCVRFYRDGGGFGSVFRWWHPISWVTWLVTLQICGWVGEPVNNVVRFRLSPYWRERRDQIEWL
jgi:hypothetical protein